MKSDSRGLSPHRTGEVGLDTLSNIKNPEYE